MSALCLLFRQWDNALLAFKRAGDLVPKSWAFEFICFSLLVAEMCNSNSISSAETSRDSFELTSVSGAVPWNNIANVYMSLHR